MTIGQDSLAGISADAVQALIDGRHGDPFSILGQHNRKSMSIVRALAPGAQAIDVVAREDSSLLGRLELAHPGGLFAGVVAGGRPYRLRLVWPNAVQETEDPYSFDLLLGELDLHLIAQGRHYELGRCLGAQATMIGGIKGVRFAVWAPNARRVSVVGDFNTWDGRRHPMRLRGEAGVWELFVPRIGPGALYKYELLGPNGALLAQKADPVARESEASPGTASIVASNEPFVWTDGAWITDRAKRQNLDGPMSFYEVHAGSWLRIVEEDFRSLTWTEMAERLVPYLVEMGFTHLEFLPIAEYPLGTRGATSRSACSLRPAATAGRRNLPRWSIAVIRRESASSSIGCRPIFHRHLGPCPLRRHGAVRTRGSARGLSQGLEHLYLQSGSRRGERVPHRQRPRMDRALSRRWVKGRRCRLHALPRLQPPIWRVGPEPLRGEGKSRVNRVLQAPEQRHRAKKSRRPDGRGGVDSMAQGYRVACRRWAGFSLKWNMGWMHHTLRYMSKDPIYRSYEHHSMTFGMLYAHSERYVLPLSHDEVVHGKGSLIGKMPGDNWKRFANLRAYFGWMWTFPGKKLLFMGGEIAQWNEWTSNGSIEWNLLDYALHRGVQTLIVDLNALYRKSTALYGTDNDPNGFQWVVADDSANSVYAFLRRGRDGSVLLVVSNMTPVPRDDYRLRVPDLGNWRELLNTDAGYYGGSNLGNGGWVAAQRSIDGSELALTLPPLTTIILAPEEARI